MYRALASALFFSLLCAAAHSMPRYIAQELPADGQRQLAFTSINDSGHGVVHWMNPESNSAGYYFWSPETGYLTIEAPRGTRVRNVSSINDRDHVVGMDDEGNGFVWSPDGLSTRLAPPAGYASVLPLAVNDRGIVVGRVENGVTRRSFYLTPKMTSAAVDESHDDNDTSDINASGAVLIQEYSFCSSYCGDLSQIYLLKNGLRTPLQLPQPRWGSAWINDAEEVAANVEDVGDGSAGYWSAATGFVSFEIQSSEAIGIARRGLVGGNKYRRDGDPSEYAFLWTKREGAKKLVRLIRPDGPPLSDLKLSAMSEGGVLAGYTSRAAFVLTPVKQSADSIDRALVPGRVSQ